MKRHYQNLLDAKLTQLFYEGFTRIERWELRSWFDKEGGNDRISKGVWEEIESRWSELFFEDDEGYSTFQVIKLLSDGKVTTPHAYMMFLDERVVYSNASDEE